MLPALKTGDNSCNPHVKTLSLSIGVTNTMRNENEPGINCS
jgi:hypothetical protein